MWSHYEWPLWIRSLWGLYKREPRKLPHLDLGLPSVHNCGKETSIVYKPPSLWYPVTAAWMDTHSKSSIDLFFYLAPPYLFYPLSSQGLVWEKCSNENKDCKTEAENPVPTKCGVNFFGIGAHWKFALCLEWRGDGFLSINEKRSVGTCLLHGIWQLFSVRKDEVL